MTAGDVFVYGPFEATDTAAIKAGLEGNVVVADDVTVHEFKGCVYYTVIKAA